MQARRKRGGRSVNPISTRGAHYPHPVLYAPPQIFRPCDGPVMYVVAKVEPVMMSKD